MSTLPKIAIIGAGPSGLTLARLLHVSDVKVDTTLYELDDSPTSRVNQGGCLDLHTDTGLAAIRKMGLWDSYRKYARYDGQEMIIADKNLTKLVHLKGGPKEGEEGERPEIDRESLRKILLESVPVEMIKWGRRLKEVTDDGQLKFEGRGEVEGPFDLIVGADGAWSKVRDRLIDEKPSYSGVSGFELEIVDPAKSCPETDKMMGRGSFFGMSDMKLLNAQRMGTGNVKIRTWFQCPEHEAQETLKRLGNQGVVDMLLQKYADWTPEQKEMLKQSDPDKTRVWSCYELPVGTRWEHKSHLTLMGDAASLAAPFSGEGVNKAMKDALELAELIEMSQNSDVTLDEAVQTYEEKMFPRSKSIQEATQKNIEGLFAPDAPAGFLRRMVVHKTSESSSVIIRALGSAPVMALFSAIFWLLQQYGWAVRKYWRGT